MGTLCRICKYDYDGYIFSRCPKCGDDAMFYVVKVGIEKYPKLNELINNIINPFILIPRKIKRQLRRIFKCILKHSESTLKPIRN